MRKPARIQTTSLALIGMLSLPIQAQVIPGRWKRPSTSLRDSRST